MKRRLRKVEQQLADLAATVEHLDEESVRAEQIGAACSAARLAEAVGRILATFELSEVLRDALQAAGDTYRSEVGS
jgi:hypothetical protein